MVNNGSVNNLLTVGLQVIIWAKTDLLSIAPQNQIWVRKLTLFIEQNQVKNVCYEWPPTTTTILYSVWHTVMKCIMDARKCNKKMSRWYFEYTYDMKSNLLFSIKTCTQNSSSLSNKYTSQIYIIYLQTCNSAIWPLLCKIHQKQPLWNHTLWRTYFTIKSCSFIEVPLIVKATKNTCDV